MNAGLNEITVNGVGYIRADRPTNLTPGMSLDKPAERLDGMRYVIVRTYSAGVFAGYLKERNGKEVVMLNARRIWSWAGAASLSQLATDGTSKPESCKFPCEVSRIELTEAIEIIDVTEKAEKSIKSVEVWKQ